MENATNISCNNSGNILQIAGTHSSVWVPTLLLIFCATCSTFWTLVFWLLYTTLLEFWGRFIHSHIYWAPCSMLILSNAIFSNLNILSSFDRKGNESTQEHMTSKLLSLEWNPNLSHYKIQGMSLFDKMNTWSHTKMLVLFC